MTETGPPVTKLVLEKSVSDSQNYDGAILVSVHGQPIRSHQILASVVQDALKYDPTLKTELAILPVDKLPFRRIVYVPTGPIDPDYDDVRILKRTAAKGVKRALRAGFKKPLLIVEDAPQFEDSQLVTLLGALEALYVPIQHREFNPTEANPVDHLGVFLPLITSNPAKAKELFDLANVLERGRRVACDIGDADPERMCPPRIEEYIRNVFADSCIKIDVVKEHQNFVREYPLFSAVNRAAMEIQRHQGRVVFMEYTPEDASKIKDTLFLVGKGVTYDTGGLDVKTGGNMIGMSRDKCGAAACAGFMEIVRLLKPAHVKVVIGVGLVRNSVGANGYVADEVITARSGARVRIVNSDAEGRMIMADVLCKLKEAALEAVNPHLFTVATLTGHAFLAWGEGYSIVMDNGPARKAKNSQRLQQAGDAIGDVFEISTVRRDDFNQHKEGVLFGVDIKQSNNVPSSRTPRGHQGPAAFLILASGLDKHGSGSTKPLKYTHLDIAGSAGEYPEPGTGAPVHALTKAYLLQNE